MSRIGLSKELPISRVARRRKSTIFTGLCDYEKFSTSIRDPPLSLKSVHSGPPLSLKSVHSGPPYK